MRGWKWWQIVAHLGSLYPLALLLWDYWQNNLTVNPIQALTLRTGWYALILLILSLACTPVNTVFGVRQALALRKPFGLYAFMYAALHFLVFIALDFGLNFGLIVEEIFSKRFALIGFVAFLVLLALAITSTKGWQKRLRKNWKRLHRGAYLAGILAAWHFLEAAKEDFAQRPVTYGSIILFLLILRIPVVRKQANKLQPYFQLNKKKKKRAAAT